MPKERDREKEKEKDRKAETHNHLSIHQWVRSAIFAPQQHASPIGFLFLKLPPPPCAVLLVLQSLHKTHSCITLYYKACTKHFPVLLCTAQLAQSTFQYYFVLQSLHKTLPSTTLYCKACTEQLPSTTVYYKACTNYFPVLWPSSLNAATTMRSAETELQNTIELRATASAIAAPKPDLDARTEKRRFWSTF